MTKFRRPLILSVIVAGFVAAFYLRYINNDRQKAPEVRHWISAELKPNASSDDIEAFFQRHDIDYSFDKYNDRYRGIIRNVDHSLSDHAVVIYMNTDKKRCYLSSEASDSFTMP